MRLEFEYSPEDLREALTVVRSTITKPSQARHLPLILYWIGLLGYAVILNVFGASRMNDKALVFVILPLIPVGWMLGALTFNVYMQAAGKTIKPWEIFHDGSSSEMSGWVRTRQMGVAAFFLALACGFPLIHERLYGDIPGSTAFFCGAFAVLAILALIAVWAQVSNEIRARTRMPWQLQTYLHGPVRIEIDDQNMLISSTQWSSRLRWSAFQGFTETPNLIILYLSTTAFHMLPKRAITSPADLNELSRILVQYVQHGHLFPRPSAFPVSPIPAIPVETVPEAQG